MSLALLVGVAACSDSSSPVSPDSRLSPSDAAKLAIAGKTVPTAPQSVTATAGYKSATVSWKAPSSNGGLSISYYQITSHPSNVRTNVSGSQTTGTVKGLANGTAYYFTVAAINALGRSPESAHSNTVTPGTTTTPTNTAPTASISAPANGASYAQGASVTFTGAGTDAEDGALSGASLVWTSSINGQIGTGASVSTSTLSAGTHTITLTAKDSKGATGTATRTVTITTSAPPPPPPGAKWVTGYYVGYQRSMYPETSVDFSALTHVVLGTVIPQASGAIDTAFYVDNVNGPKMARALSARAHAAGRKAILMLAGAGYHDALLSASSAANRAKFVSNLLGAMDRLGYDGIDVDWEPVNTSDQPSALALVQALRQARPNMILTFPVYWVGAGTRVDPWYATLAQSLDQLNLMSYEMAGNWGGWVSWHSSALAGEGSDHPSSVSSSATAYKNAGVPIGKIGAGMGTYGSCWQGVNDMRKPLSGSAGTVAGDNVMTYPVILSQYYSAAAYHWDAAASAGYLAFAAPTGPRQCTLVSYETPQGAAAKGAYIKSAGLGGAIVWTINQGHVPTAPAGQQDPLTQALYNAMQ